MSTHYIQIFVGIVIAGIGFSVGWESDSPVIAWLSLAVGTVIAQIGVIAAGVHQGTERLYRALGDIDDAVSVALEEEPTGSPTADVR